MTITSKMDPRSLSLSELSDLPLQDWIRLKSLHPTRYQQLIDYVEHPGKRDDPDHEAWKREQTEEASLEKQTHDSFFSDVTFSCTPKRNYFTDCN